MMRRDAATNDRVPMTMTTHFRVLLDKRAHEFAACLAATVVRITSRKRGLRRRLIATTSRRQENDRRQQVVTVERGDQRRRRHLRHALFLVALIGGHPRYETSVRQQHRGTQWHWPLRWSSDHAATHATHFLQPQRKLVRVANRRRQQQQPNARRRQDDRFFPNVTALLVGEIVRFVKHDEVGADFTSTAQGIEKLIAINLCGPDDQRRVRIFLAVTGQYSHPPGTELVDELLVLGIRERLQRRRVPGASPVLEQAANLLARDPRLAATGRRGHEHVFVLEQREGFSLKRVGFEGRRAWRADAFEQAFDFA